MKPSQIIKNAYKLIEKEENWTQDFYEKRKPDGTTSYCAIGALQRADTAGAPTRSYYRAREALAHDALVHGHCCISVANDNSNHAAVLRAFRRVYRQLVRQGK